MHTKAVHLEGEDRSFLFAVFASDRRAELELGGLAGDALAQMLELQYRLQSCAYAQHFPHLDREIIYVGELRVGYWYVDRSGPALRLVDIALLPQHRGRGVGEHLLRRLQDEAASTRRHVSLTVRPESKARRLYERLGFVAVAKSDTAVAMEWTPPAKGPVAAEQGTP